jgi:hypothetical protein
MKTHKNEYGCLMAMVSETHCPHIIKFGKTVIPPEILYTKPDDDSYGYDNEPHVTIKYGFEPDLSRNDLAQLLRGLKPFNIILNAISQFNNSEYDVIKFNAESPILRELRNKVDGYPNKDKYPDYKPHMTMAYVKPGSFKTTKDGLNIILPVNKIKYSGKNGKIIYINL